MKALLISVITYSIGTSVMWEKKKKAQPTSKISKSIEITEAG